MKKFSLGKSHKLCGAIAVERLFSDRAASGAISFPLRAVWHAGSRRNDGDQPVKFLISVPKKRLRHAVDRVTMRRRVREAYRLNHVEFETSATAENPIDVAFIYVAGELKPYAAIERAMRRLLASIHSLSLPSDETSAPTTE